MNEIKLGIIGLGQRGSGLLRCIVKNFNSVKVVAVCDEYEDRVKNTQKVIFEKRHECVKGFTDYKDLLKEDLTAVIIAASWEAHIPIAIDALKARKIVGLEVGGAYSVEDCYRLVRIQEETGTPLMFLENCCYGKIETTIENMVKQGVFGEISYCHGSYCHDLREEICGGIKNRHYRLRNYMTRNCDNYPTHELGPIAKILNINNGNRMLKLSSFSSKSCGLSDYVKDKEEYKFLRGEKFAQGDIVVTNIICANGELITLKLDTTLVRAYSREFTVSGTKAFFSEVGQILLTDKCDFDHEKNINEYLNSYRAFEEKYVNDSWKNITEEEIKAGHGGMDVLMLKDFFEHIISGEKMPIDVYDAASWMVVSCLSEQSLALGGATVDIPDFTTGKWSVKTNV